MRCRTSINELCHHKVLLVFLSLLIMIAFSAMVFHLVEPFYELNLAASEVENCGGIVDGIVFTPKYISYSGSDVGSQLECSLVALNKLWSVDQITLAQCVIDQRTMKSLKRVRSLKVLILRDVELADGQLQALADSLPGVEIVEDSDEREYHSTLRNRRPNPVAGKSLERTHHV